MERAGLSERPLTDGETERALPNDGGAGAACCTCMRYTF